MKTNSTLSTATLLGWGLAVCLFCGSNRVAAQFVELTAELECDNWSYWLLEDQRGRQPKRSVFSEPLKVRCVVGTNIWMMEGDFPGNSRVTRWFTGSEILERRVVTLGQTEREKERASRLGLPPQGDPPPGHKVVQTYPSSDGNPGRPVRVMDLMEMRGRVCWLAFCSGSVLRREGRQLFPPSDLWKELMVTTNGFPDRTTVYQDGLGLPQRVELFTPNERCLFQYQVRQTTNVSGWNFPLEFYALQYKPVGTNGWELQMTAKGRITSIRPTTEMQIPAELALAPAK